jgi:uncharacterized protein (DUF302 family)
MKRKLLMLIVVAATTLAFSGMAVAQSSIVKVESQHNFNQTISKLKSATSQNGLMVMGHINQGHALSMTGLHMNGEAFLVGNPNVGKKLFSVDHAVGLFIPARIFVYQGKNGRTYVSYDRPSAELDQFNNPKISMMAKMLDKKLDSIAQSATH